MTSVSESGWIVVVEIFAILFPCTSTSAGPEISFLMPSKIRALWKRTEEGCDVGGAVL